MSSTSKPRAIGWRRRRFTRTILGMRAMDATVRRLLVSSLAVLGLGCKKLSPVGKAPADAGTVVTVYVPPDAVDRLMGRLTAIAARHQWALSVRTDAAALAEADLVVADSAGSVVRRLRPGSPGGGPARPLRAGALRLCG